MQHEQTNIIETLGTFLSPIDADSIPDDDVILLSSFAWVSTSKSQSRRKQPVTVITIRAWKQILGKQEVGGHE
ncbi:hypothetical protein KFK09_002152 [Dendrobium nobile]|uniref:Uncharacterized protein n=1 Tax=Dendrobium nobile TaxID=94219 RepID=A0A8T3C9F3_DENNO|nr:hypothetical protein KFK09_002152 [Dendrobium nobile]